MKTTDFIETLSQEEMQTVKGGHLGLRGNYR